MRQHEQAAAAQILIQTQDNFTISGKSLFLFARQPGIVLEQFEIQWNQPPVLGAARNT